MDRIILAFASERAHAQLTRTLGSGGLVPTVSCFSGAEAIRAARKLGSAVVICGFHGAPSQAPPLRRIPRPGGAPGRST